MNYLYQKFTLLLLIFFFCFSLVIIRWYKVPMANSTYAPRTGVYGDVWSCLNVHSAAMHFQDHGFKETVGLPMFGYTGNFNDEGTYAYTHYPPLPDELAGLYARISGSKDIKVLSLFPMLLSVFFFFLIYFALQVIYTDKPAAFIAATLTVISCYFICWADDLHQHVYGESCKWLFILLLYLYYTGNKYKRPLFIGLCLLSFINSFITYEHIVYYAIAIIGFSLIYKRKLITKENILLLLMPVIGFLLHLLQNYFYFKSWDMVLADVKGAVVKRTVGNEGDIQMGAKEWAKMPYNILFRFTRMYFINAYSFIILAILAMRQLRRSNKQHYYIGWVLFVASISWVFFMPQHAYIHLFTIRHFGLFYAFIVGIGIRSYIDIFKKHWVQRKKMMIALHGIFVLFTVGMAVHSQVYYVYLKFGYGFPLLGLEHHLF